MRLVIAGVSSGTGKTTIVTGLLAALKARGLAVQPFKVGPDYIDPGFHKLAAGLPSHNLDSWLVPEDKIQDVFYLQAEKADIAIVEGVMGLYDGGKNGVSSTAQIAKRLQAPVILVLNAKAMSESAAAIVLGFKNYDPEINIAGVIVNNLGSKSHAQIIAQAIEKIGVPVVGCVLRRPEMSLPERHLGLTPTEEQEQLLKRIEVMKQAVQEDIDIDKLLDIAQQVPALAKREVHFANKLQAVKIAVARDEAFSFYYPASMKVLEDLGAELIYFSPLKDTTLPQGISGLIFGGGFPEMFAQELSDNQGMLQAIRTAQKRKMPIYAECGGFMYASRAIVDFEGREYQMLGLVPGICQMQKKLQTVGYVQTKALQNNALMNKGEVIRGHEFHFSSFQPDCEAEFSWAFEFTKMRTGNSYCGGYVQDNLVTSYLHMHFLGNVSLAENFINKCAGFARNAGETNEK